MCYAAFTSKAAERRASIQSLYGGAFTSKAAGWRASIQSQPLDAFQATSDKRLERVYTLTLYAAFGVNAALISLEEKKKQPLQ